MRATLLCPRARETALPARAPRRAVFAHINPPGKKGGGGFPWQQQQHGDHKGWGGLHSALQSLRNMAGSSSSSAKIEQDFSGTWNKDLAASDSLDDALRLMQLGGIMRQAVKLVRGVSIEQSSEQFVFRVFSVLTWFKVTETYKFNGEPSMARRRDLRRGKHTGTVLAPARDKLQLSLTWGEPHGGHGTDDFFMPSRDELHITSTINVGGETARYRSIFKRKGA